mmetsp:Transcript_108260/g.302522  ORF Transcript_108260/g.302522 Transcript_108260/m.302522 type:complete len:599 (+) Transcript_108260:46-1842(+)
MGQLACDPGAFCAVESIDSTVPGGGVETLAVRSQVELLAGEDEDLKDFQRMSQEYGMDASSSSREKRERRVRRLNVRGAGLQDVNGVYRGAGKFADGHLFVKETPLGKVYIRRQGEEEYARSWRITLSASSRDGMHLYKREQAPVEQTDPPVLGWEVCSAADGVAEAHAGKLGKPPEKLDVSFLPAHMMNGSSSSDILRPLQLEDNTVELDLEVAIIRAGQLRNMDEITHSDPYCLCTIPGKLPLAGKSRLKTTVITDELDPVWNFRDIMPGYEVGDSLQFEVFDEDIGGDELIGMARLSHEDFYPNGFQGELSLTDKKGAPLQGELSVALTLFKVVVGPRGRAEQQKRRRKLCKHVQVAIISASGLAVAGGEMDCDPYCVCRIADAEGSPEDEGPHRAQGRSQGAHWKRRYGRAEAKGQIETHVIPRTRNPTWRYLDELSLYAEGDALFFEVWDRDVGKEDDFIGHVVLTGDKIMPNGFLGELQLLDASDAPLEARLNICIIPPFRDVPGIRCRFDVREGKLGVKIVPDEQGDAFFIRKVFEDGLVDKWNIANPQQRILADDRVIEVNGIRGSAKDLISTVACCKGEMEWLLTRAIV